MKRSSSAYRYAKQTGLNDKSLLIIVSVISFTQGLIESTDDLFDFIFKDDYKFDPEESSFFSSLSTFPWTLQLFWGIISDSYPICGYKRKSYLILTSLLGWFALVNFGFDVPPPFYLGLCYYVLNSVSQSFQSVIAEATLVESVQKENSVQDYSEEKKSEIAADRLSFYYTSSLVGGIVYTLFTIVLLKNQNRHKFMFCTSFIPLAVLVCAFLLKEKSIKQKAEILIKKGSLLGERAQLLEADYNQIEEGEKKKYQKNDDEEEKVTMSSVRQAFAFLKTPVIMQAWIYVFLSHFGASSGKADFYYNTEILEFSPSFIGVTTLIGKLAGIIGIFVYTKFYAGTSLRKFYTITTLLQSLFSLSNIILYLRLNERIGIPDKVFVCLNTIPAGFFEQICLAPINVLACRLCPKGLEATTYAILMSTLGLGTALSTQFGALIQKKLAIKKHNYTNYWQFSIISECIAVIVLIIMWRIKYEKATKHVDDMNFKALEEEEIEVRKATLEIRRKSTKNLQF